MDCCSRFTFTFALIIRERFDTYEEALKSVGQSAGYILPRCETGYTLSSNKDSCEKTKEDGTKYTQAPWSFQTVVDRLGLNEGRGKRDRIVFRSIRHTVATRLAQRLGSRDLMDVMGWRTVQMAMRYVHGNDEAKTKALEMLGTAPQQGKILPFNHAKAN